MGRKAIQRVRKPLTPKAKIWVRELVPQLQAKELDKLALDELADLMGKSKSTIYSYFSTKDEIYHTAVKLVLEDLMFVVSPDAIEGDNKEMVLRNMLYRISEGLEGLSIGFLEQIQHHYPEIWLEVKCFTDKLLANFEILYSEGMRRGAFRNYNLQLLLALDRHFIMSVMTDTAQFSTQGITLKDLVSEYLELRLNALKVN